MTKNEIISLIRVLTVNYQKWPAYGKMADLVELWLMTLSDMPYEVAKAATALHMSRSVYPPTIAAIREAAAEIAKPRVMDFSEAWEHVCKAIREFGFYRQEEAMASMPPDVAAMVRRFTWREICLSENSEVLRAQFRMAWDTQAKRQTERNILPDDIVALLDGDGAIKRLN